MQNFQRKYLIHSPMTLRPINKIQYVKGHPAVDFEEDLGKGEFWKVIEVQSPKDREVRVPNISIQPRFVYDAGVGCGKFFNSSEPGFVSCSWETSVLIVNIELRC